MARDGQETVGFIGLGLMGHGMAKNIVEKGYPLAVTAHRNRKPLDDLSAAARWPCASQGGRRGARRSSSSASPARARSRRSCAAPTG